MDELHEKIARLPAWAREHIKRLEKCRQPLLEEVDRYQKRAARSEKMVQKLSEANKALLEILQRAGESGHDWSKLVVFILEGYEIFRSNPEG